MSLEHLRRRQLSILQQFEASVFYTVVRWHKLNEVNNECTLHISIVLAICVRKIIKFDGYLTKFWQKQLRSFLAHPVVYFVVVVSDVSNPYFMHDCIDCSDQWSYQLCFRLWYQANVSNPTSHRLHQLNHTVEIACLISLLSFKWSRPTLYPARHS